ncbi:MAG: mechanosensitive ion channel domain-containing protein [Bacteroidota bacterium]
MLPILIDQIKKKFPIQYEVPFLGGGTWSYVTLLVLLVGTFLATWVSLKMLKRLLFSSDKQLDSFRRFKDLVYYLTLFGLLLHTKPLLGFPENAFWQNFYSLCSIIFVLVSLLAVNRLVEVAFGLLSRRMQKEHWNELGIVHLLFGISRFISLGSTLLVGIAYLFDFNIPSLLTKLSIGAGTITAVVALASKDLISNFFGALVITIGKPFRLGDWIIVNGLEGRVTAIDMRSTQLQTARGTMIYVPNSTFVSKHISNYGRSVYVPLSLTAMLWGVEKEKIHAFLSQIQALFKTYPKLKSERCKIEMGNSALDKVKLTLHLYFKKMTEKEVIEEMQVLIAALNEIASQEKITLEN